MNVLISKRKKILLLMICIGLSCCLLACASMQKIAYYSEINNYIEATGTITDISYNADSSVLYLSFSNLVPIFDDVCFKIVGDNLAIVQNNRIDQKLNVGDHLDFITAPQYFGDGYVMPIVALSVNGEELLPFDVGYINFINWLKSQ